jgi:hypothetical protein
VVFVVFLLDFGTVPTVWYLLFFYCILELFWQCVICCFSIVFLNCSDSVVFAVFLLYFRTVQTVWYLLFFYCILELFRQCGIFVFLLYFRTALTVWYLLFVIWLTHIVYYTAVHVDNQLMIMYPDARWNNIEFIIQRICMLIELVEIKLSMPLLCVNTFLVGFVLFILSVFCSVL